MKMNLENGIEILKEHLVTTTEDYQKGLRHAIWILEEKLDEEERKEMYQYSYEK